MQSTNCEKAHVKATEGRMTLMKLQEGGIATDIEVELEKELSHSLKAKETQSLSSNRYNTMFAESLIELVIQKDSPNIQVFTAKTQADHILVKFVVKGQADVILRNDGNFPVYIGGNGITITDFKYDSRKKLLREFTLSSGFGSVI
jgi:hypothetical protein